MMPILFWEKPQKIMSDKEWGSIVADSAPPGVYTPNMSSEDMSRWKAKFTGAKKSDDEKCVEIRKTTDNGCQMLIKVRLNGIVISANGQLWLDNDQYGEMQTAIAEAKLFLEAKTTK